MNKNFIIISKINETNSYFREEINEEYKKITENIEGKLLANLQETLKVKKTKKIDMVELKYLFIMLFCKIKNARFTSKYEI